MSNKIKVKKSKAELYAEYKKSNKKVRPRLAKREGFKSEAAYLKYLLGTATLKASIKAEAANSTTVVTPEEKKTIIIVNILDASGSMGGNNIYVERSLWSTAKDGVKQDLKNTIEENNKGDINYLYGLYVFSGRETTVKSLQLHPAKSRLINELAFPFYGGTTALNDAVYTVLDTLVRDIPKLVNATAVVKIFTDGEENDSHRRTHEVQDIIKRAESLGITVVYVGDEKYASDAVHNLGLRPANVITHTSSLETVAASYSKMAESTIQYSTRSRGGATKDELVDNFFTKEAL